MEEDIDDGDDDTVSFRKGVFMLNIYSPPRLLGLER